MANLIPEIAEMLGLKLGEEFKIDTSGDDIFNRQRRMVRETV